MSQSEISERRYLSGALSAVVLAGLLPAFNFFLKFLLLGEVSDFFLRRIYLPALVSVLAGLIWVFWRSNLSAFLRIAFPRSRLGALSLFLTVGYLSQVFFGFWHSGVAGWTYEEYGANRISVGVPNPSSRSGIDSDHVAVIEKAFEESAPFSLALLSGEKFCWTQDAIVADAVIAAEGEKTIRSVLITAESLGFVFSDYVYLQGRGTLLRSLNARVAGETTPINWRTFYKRVGWDEWRYWSHTPSVSGYYDFSPVDSFLDANVYDVTSCVLPDASVEVAEVKVKNG